VETTKNEDVRVLCVTARMAVWIEATTVLRLARRPRSNPDSKMTFNRVGRFRLWHPFENTPRVVSYPVNPRNFLVGVVGFEPTTLEHQPNKINDLRNSEPVHGRCGGHHVCRVPDFFRRPSE
jgi:hypothetical protein